MAVIDLAGLDALIAALRDDDYDVVGPRLRDGAVVYDRIEGTTDLPAGWGDAQEAGTYQLVRRDDNARFGYTAGVQSWKPYLLPPRAPVFTAERHDGTFRVEPSVSPPPRYAFIGVRACELAAIAIQDRVFVRDSARDELYASRRQDLFVVAVQCTAAAATCFCVSMGTGPRARRGFDLALTELTGDDHRFLVEVGSPEGAALLERIPYRDHTDDDARQADALAAAAAHQMGRALDTDGIKGLLYANLDHPRWDDVAERCLACGNCTSVCPTCFCTTVADTTTDVAGAHAQRERLWDSCFTVGFSYIHGGPIRPSVRSRYRQWMTHKLASWIDQFGTSGCVGCGRCITWCPVGIDITAEAAAIRAAPHTPAAPP